MIYPVKTDLVPLLENLIAAIQPYAKANNIRLQMLSSVEQVEFYYHPEMIISDLTRLICRIIAFTPQNYDVEFILPEQEYDTDYFLIIIKNSGASLSALQNNILNEIKLKTILQETKTEGNQFLIHIPMFDYEESVENEYILTQESKSTVFQSPFYKTLNEHLKDYFISIRNPEKTDETISQRDGIFLNC